MHGASRTLAIEQASMQHQQHHGQLTDHQQDISSILTHPVPLMLHQLPFSALAAIASHLRCADKLVLGRLVLSKADPAAAAAVLNTIHSCSIRSSSLVLQPYDCLAVAARPPLQQLQQLHLQLDLPHVTQPAPCWMGRITTLQELTQLTSLEMQLTVPAPVLSNPQHHQQQQQWIALLLEAGGQLVQCKRLALKFSQAHPQPRSELAAAAPYAAALPLQAQHGLGWALCQGASVFQPLSQLTGLQDLSIHTPGRLQGAALPCFAPLKRLTALALTCSKGGAGGGAYAAAGGLGGAHANSGNDSSSGYISTVRLLGPVLPQLQRLSLRGYLGHHETTTLQLLTGLRPGTIRQLDVSYMPNLSSSVTALARLTSLQELSLVDVGLIRQPDSMEVLASSLKQLTMLACSGTGFGYGFSNVGLGAGCLAGMTSLQDLRLHDCCLYDSDLAVLGQLTNLTRLDIGSQHPGGGAHITPAGVSNGLSSLKKLVYLDLTGIRLGAAGTSWLQQLQGLTELRLNGCRAGAAAVARLRAALPGLVVVNMEPLDWAEEGLEWLIGDYW